MIPIDLLIYLGIGGLNAVVAGAQDKLMILHHRDKAAFVELAFYVLLWPAQLLFWTFVGTSRLIDAIGFRFMGGRSKPRPKHRGPRRPT
jgi:hypothetical protein